MALHATGRARVLVLLIVVVTIVGLSVLLWARGRKTSPETAAVNLALPTPLQRSSTTPPATPAPPTSATALNPEVNQASPVQAPLDDSIVSTLKLIIPVVGVRPDQLIDTFSDARSEGRVHDAIDIPAAAGTSVVAAADGEIIKLFQSERGGTTIYLLSTDRKLVFYYAHLQRYADGLGAGKFAKQGEIIGYVGDTGNAGAGNFHLHFSISVVADPKRYWEGTSINPYPLLRKS